MMSMLNYIITVILVFGIASVLSAQKERKYIRQGNNYYNKASKDTSQKDSVAFNKAEIAYRKAIEKDPKSFEAAFNLGDALYKQKKFQEAANEFQVLAHSQKDKLKLSKLYHNIGNSLLQAQKLDEAIEAYKNALKNNPKDMETKYNLAFAQRLKKQQQQQQQCQNKQDQDKDQQQQQQQKQEQKKEEKQQQQQKNQISKEDAKRMLDAQKEDEKKLLEKIKEQQMKAKRVKIEKDW